MTPKVRDYSVRIRAGLAAALDDIAERRGFPLDADEVAEAIRLTAACARAQAGEPEPAGPQPGLIGVAIPIGGLVLRTPTVAARVRLAELQHWPFPPELTSDAARAEYAALLSAWVLDHGRELADLELLRVETAPAIVADLRSRFTATLRELQAAIGEVVRDLYPMLNPVDIWADADPDRPAPADIDWASVLLALSSESGDSTAELLTSPDSRVWVLWDALRRRRAAERAAIEDHSTSAPDPDAPKVRASRAWHNFESRLLARRRHPHAEEPAT